MCGVECGTIVCCWDKQQHSRSTRVSWRDMSHMKEYRERAYDWEWDLHYEGLGGMSYKELEVYGEERERVREGREGGCGWESEWWARS